MLKGDQLQPFSVRVATLACLSLVTLAGGCATQPPGPADTLRRFADALDQADYRSAYWLMSSEYRSQASVDEFVRALNENPAEARDAVEALRQVGGEPEPTARIRYGLGDELTFVLEGREWRIDTPVLEFYGQSTPREALRSFIRAIERRRYDVALRLAPEQYRDRMSVEMLRNLWEGAEREHMQQLVENLRANIDTPIEETGDTATMQYMERYTCRFVREDGAWRIEDPD